MAEEYDMEFRRHFIVSILVPVLVSSSLPAVSFAATPSAATARGFNDKAKSLIDQLSLATTLPVSEQVIKEKQNEIDVFLVEHGNELKGPPGQTLAQNLVKWKRILDVKHRFEKCLNGRLLGNKLPESTLKFMSQLDGSEYCGELNPIQTVKQLGAVLAANAQAVSDETVRTSMIANVRRNSVVNTADMLYRIYTDNPRPGLIQNSKDTSPRQIADIAVKQACGGCSAAEQEKFLNAALTHVEGLKSNGVPRISFQNATDSLNDKVEALNGALTTPRGTANEVREKNYRAYTETLTREASFGEGLLLWTNAAKNVTGGTVGQESFISDKPVSRQNYGGVKFQYPEIKGRFKPADVLNATREYYDSLKQSATALPNQDLKQLIKENPLAIAQTLATNPEMTGRICEIMIELDREGVKSDRHYEGLNYVKYIAGGLLAVGGVLLAATGVGAAPGAALTAEGLTILGAGALYTGAIFSTADAATSYYYASDARRELRELSASAFRGNLTESSIEDRAKFETRAADETIHFIGTVGMSTASAGPLLNAAGKSARIFGTRLDRELSIFSGFRKARPQALSEEDIRKALQFASDAIGEDKMAKLIGHVSQADPVEQRKILQRLADIHRRRTDTKDLRAFADGLEEEIERACR